MAASKVPVFFGRIRRKFYGYAFFVKMIWKKQGDGDLLDMETFGRRIAVLRRRAELTQGDVAKVCCVTVQAVSKWERGLSCPDALMLETLSRALGVSVQDFFCDTAPKA